MLAGQEIEHHIPTCRLGGQCLHTGIRHCFKPVDGNDAQDTDELPVAVRSLGQGEPDFLERLRQVPFLERRSVAQSARFVAPFGSGLNS